MSESLAKKLGLPMSLWLFLVVAALLAGLSTRHFWEQRSLRVLPVDDVAGVDALFAVRFKELQGASEEPVSLERWRGRPMVVNFWATWCEPCRKEIPSLDALQAAFAQTPLKVVGLGLDTERNLLQFKQQVPVRYPLFVADTAGFALLSPLGDTASLLPFTVVIDEKGQVVDRFVGPVDIPLLQRSVRRVLQSGATG